MGGGSDVYNTEPSEKALCCIIGCSDVTFFIFSNFPLHRVVFCGDVGLYKHSIRLMVLGEEVFFSFCRYACILCSIGQFGAFVSVGEILYICLCIYIYVNAGVWKSVHINIC